MEEPDWRLLGAPELLRLISEKITSIADFVRFRAVCPAWRSASSPRPRHLPPQLPWLVLPQDPRNDADSRSSLSVYDLSQSKTHTLHLPQIDDKYICGSSHGWLVLEGWNEENVAGIWLLNPITRDQISLPPISAQPKSFSGGFVEDADSFCIRKAILSSNPSVDPDCFVMVLLWSSCETGICRVGDDCWTILNVREPPDFTPDPGYCVADIIYHNHLFYTIYVYGEVWSWDIRKHFVKMVASDANQHEFDYMCTVEGTSGDHGFMIFCQSYSYPATADPVYMSDIRMLSDQQQFWSNVEEQLTSNYCFFLAEDFHCISLPLDNLKLHGWGGNCVCYTSQEVEKIIDDVEWYSCSIQLYNLDDGSITTLVSNLGSQNRRYNFANFYKNSWFVWLTPTLC